MDTSNNEGVSTNAGNSHENKQVINKFLVSALLDVAENLRFTETKVGIAFAWLIAAAGFVTVIVNIWVL